MGKKSSGAPSYGGNQQGGQPQPAQSNWDRAYQGASGGGTQQGGGKKSTAAPNGYQQGGDDSYYRRGEGTGYQPSTQGEVNDWRSKFNSQPYQIPQGIRDAYANRGEQGPPEWKANQTANYGQTTGNQQEQERYQHQAPVANQQAAPVAANAQPVEAPRDMSPKKPGEDWFQYHDRVGTTTRQGNTGAAYAGVTGNQPQQQQAQPTQNNEAAVEQTDTRPRGNSNWERLYKKGPSDRGYDPDKVFDTPLPEPQAPSDQGYDPDRAFDPPLQEPQAPSTERPDDARYGVGHEGKNLSEADVAHLKKQGVTIQADGSVTPEDFKTWADTRGGVRPPPEAPETIRDDIEAAVETTAAPEPVAPPATPPQQPAVTGQTAQGVDWGASAADRRIAALMAGVSQYGRTRTEGKYTREQAMANQAEAIGKGYDYNNDGAVTDAESRRGTQPQWTGWQQEGWVDPVERARLNAQQPMAPAAPEPEAPQAPPPPPPPVAQPPQAPPPPVEQPNFQTPEGGYRAPYSTGYFRPMQGYNNNGYGQPRPDYAGSGYASLPGNGTAFYDDGETQGANPFLNNRYFEQNSYNYSDYGTPGYNPKTPGQYSPRVNY